MTDQSTESGLYPPVNYSEYLKSSKWRRIKSRVLERDSRVCYFCSGKAAVVHHRSYALDVLEGRADHLLVSLCNGCHTYVHFNNAGERLTPTATDIILLTRDAPKDFPEPQFRPGRSLLPQLPVEWPLLNAAQRAGWMARFVEVRAKAVRAAKAKKKAEAERKAARAPAEPGWIRLDDAVAQHKREMVNSYAWYRKDAMQSGRISIGSGRVHAEKRRRAWCVRVADLDEAIEAYRRDPPRGVVMGLDICDH